MIDAVVGAVIMVVATTSLLSAVEVIEKAFADAGRQPLSPQEEQLMNRVKRVVYDDGETNIKYQFVFKNQDQRTQFWQNSLKTLPREVISRTSK